MGQRDKKRHGKQPKRRLPIELLVSSSSSSAAGKYNHDAEEPANVSSSGRKLRSSPSVSSSFVSALQVENEISESNVNESCEEDDRNVPVASAVEEEPKATSEDGCTDDAAEFSDGHGLPERTQSRRRKEVFCSCMNCQRDDCGTCMNCKGKLKFGGDGKNHQRCFFRTCLNPQPKRKLHKSTIRNKKVVLATNARKTSFSNTSITLETRRMEDSPLNNLFKKTEDNAIPSLRSYRPQTNGLTSQNEQPQVAQYSQESIKHGRPTRAKRPVVDTFVEETNALAHRVRCRRCIACLRPECGLCKNCLAKRKFGGDGKSRYARASCVYRKCYVIYPPEKGMKDNIVPFPVNIEAAIMNSNITKKKNVSERSGSVPSKVSRSDVESRTELTFNNKKRNREVVSGQVEHISCCDTTTQTDRTDRYSKFVNDSVEDDLIAVPPPAKKVLISNSAPVAFAKEIRKHVSCVTRKPIALHNAVAVPKTASWQPNPKLDVISDIFASLSCRLNSSDVEHKFNSSSIRQYKNITNSNEIDQHGIMLQHPKGQNKSNDVTNDASMPQSHNTFHTHDAVTIANTAEPSNFRRCGNNSVYGIVFPTDPATTTVCGGCRGTKDVHLDGSTTNSTGSESESELSSHQKNEYNKPSDSIDIQNTITKHGSIDRSSGLPNALTVLLCDGYNCGREYHLGCCSPELSDVPSTDRWLCQDCCPENATGSLVRYLDLFDEAKAHYHHEQQVQLMAQEKICGAGNPKHNKKKTSKTNDEAQNTVPYVFHLLEKDCMDLDLPLDCDFPISELERSAIIHAFACMETMDLQENKRHPVSNISAVNDTDNGEDRHLFSSLQDSYVNCSPTLAPNGTSALASGAFLGKPVRIYNALSNQYHTGRIVDCRKALSLALSFNTNNTNKNIETETRNNLLVPLSYDECEFLVRFAAGKDERKTTHYHWIVLEEHSLAVGMTFVWSKFFNHQKNAMVWTPSIVWLRSARELVPVQHMLHVEKGEIYFRTRTSFLFGGSSEVVDSGSPSRGSNQAQNDDLSLTMKEMKKSPSPKGATKSKKKARKKIWALVRTFGREEFALVDVQKHTVDLYNPYASALYKGQRFTNTDLQYELALTETWEQINVRRWHSMKRNPRGAIIQPYGLISCLDYYGLPNLTPKGNGNFVSLNRNRVTVDSLYCFVNGNSCRQEQQRKQSLPGTGTVNNNTTLLCPNLLQGVDRSLIVRIVASIHHKKRTKHTTTPIITSLRRRIATKDDEDEDQSAPSKDVASSLVCAIVPITSELIARGRSFEEEQYL